MHLDVSHCTHQFAYYETSHANLSIQRNYIGTWQFLLGAGHVLRINTMLQPKEEPDEQQESVPSS